MNSPASSYCSSPSGGTPLKYKCECCLQAFTFKFELASHERKHHSNPEDEVMVVDEEDKTISESLEQKANDDSDVQVPSQNEIDQSSMGYLENEESNSSAKSRLKTLRRTNDRRSRDASQSNLNSDGKAEESPKSETDTLATKTTTLKHGIKRERSYSIQDENVQSDLVITSVSSMSSPSTNNNNSNKSNDHDHDENSSDSQRPSLRLRPRPSLSLSSSSVPPHKTEENKSTLNPSASSKSSHLRESNEKSQASKIISKIATNIVTKIHPSKTTTTMKKSKTSHSSVHPCPLCPKAFSTIWNMKRHLRNNHPARTSIHLRPEIHTSAAITKSKPVTRPREDENSTSFPCGICSAIFNKKSNRDVHLKIHSGQKFKCAICQSEFSRPSTLIDHIKARHMYKPPPSTSIITKTTNVQRQQSTPSQRPATQTYKMIGNRILCQYASCKSTFSRRDTMLEHVKLVHLGERRFTCPYTNCKRKFGRKDQLNSHMVHHLSSPQNKIFKCDICGKECKSDHYLRYHRKVHSKKVKSIVCPASGCSRRFFTQSDVNKHSKFAHAPKISSSLFHTTRIN